MTDSTLRPGWADAYVLELAALEHRAVQGPRKGKPPTQQQIAERSARATEARRKASDSSRVARILAGKE